MSPPQTPLQQPMLAIDLDPVSTSALCTIQGPIRLIGNIGVPIAKGSSCDSDADTDPTPWRTFMGDIQLMDFLKDLPDDIDSFTGAFQSKNNHKLLSANTSKRARTIIHVRRTYARWMAPLN